MQDKNMFFPDCLDYTDLSKYEKVNKCETHKDLANVIRDISDKDGFIRGRNGNKSAILMADFCEKFTDNINKNKLKANFLTREYGIRQQALYIYYYECLDI